MWRSLRTLQWVVGSMSPWVVVSCWSIGPFRFSRLGSLSQCVRQGVSDYGLPDYGRIASYC
eukprot:3973312-Alexandrium_andersonii.AAC.1